MTKADLIEEVSRLAELTRKDSEVIVDTIFDSVVRSLRVGDKIEIRGFGSFRTRQRKPRVGRNPKTGDRVEVPAKKIPFFKPSKELKDLVNSSAPAEVAAPAPPAPLCRPTPAIDERNNNPRCDVSDSDRAGWREHPVPPQKRPQIHPVNIRYGNGRAHGSTVRAADS